MSEPHLTRGRQVRPRPRGLALMLHGGAEHDLAPVTAHSRPWQRSRLMMTQLHRPFRAAGVEVWLLRYRFTGWNLGHGSHPSPVADARWALDRVREDRGSVPVVLLGHSMGARTAVTVADDPDVLGVVALAPWFPPGQPVQPLAGRRLVAAHGRPDRVTSFDATAGFVRRAAAVASSAEMVDMGGLGHYLLAGMRRWNDVALKETISTFERVELAARTRTD